MTNEELLRDYISYHYVEGNIDNEQRIKMEFAAANYLQQLKQLNIHSVSVSSDGKYRKLAGIHDKYTCPQCENTPDVIHPNSQESTCFKDKIKWEYN